MLLDEDQLAFLLRLEGERAFEVEDFSTIDAARERVSVASGGRVEVYELRRARDDELAQNDAAIREALDRVSYPGVAPLIAVAGDLVVVSNWIEGLPAAGLNPEPGHVQRAVDLLADLHSLDVSEGLDWELDREALAGDRELPLHRLGFAVEERQAAAASLGMAREELIASPAGFSHRNATALNLNVHGAGVSFSGWESAGFGFQLHDLAALLWTLPLSGDQRKECISQYSAKRPEALLTVDVVDLIALRWGLLWLMALPRHLVETLGDESETERLRAMAAAVERGIREPLGSHPAAAGIRAALWQR